MNPPAGGLAWEGPPTGAWPLFLFSLEIEWTAYGSAAALEYMCIDHGGADIFVSQEFLHRANIIAVC
jgi:hypothetical protein